MKLTRLRVVGFKTFVEPTDVPIEPGLTGVVGPNGCGKSNLVEALRWVMGESSHKNLRAGGMDDVIFAGSTSRPSRNTAEVTLSIDNTERGAPAAFNDADAIEISRRIEREQGSTYRLNGREVRARDVQILFADAASGARSPALVRQGQIAELIAAKPQARRRILEDAAGIAGLHARRNEAELRLKHAEENLVRLEDVLREIGVQVEGLRRQDRQAQRYRAISAEIRKVEAELQAAGYRRARAELDEAEAEAGADVRAVIDRTAEQAGAARAQAVAGHGLQPLREAEAAEAAALRRVSAARADLEHEERRARERLADLETRIVEIERDVARQAGLQSDAGATITRLGQEAAEITRAEDDATSRRASLESAAAAAQASLLTAEKVLADAQTRTSDLSAQRETLRRSGHAAAERAARLVGERDRATRDLGALDGQRNGSLGPLRQALDEAQAALDAADAAAAQARVDLSAARDGEATHRSGANEAERNAARLETELRTLAKLFASPTGPGVTMLDLVTASRGYETALAAALGEDLDASPDPTAPVRWIGMDDGVNDPPLPAGLQSLDPQVRAPAAMRRRLRQVGIVERAEGSRLAPLLRPGQRLVSTEGDLWRWDGLTVAAEAPSAAARRLAEKNRLADLEARARTARTQADERRADAAGAEARLRAVILAESVAANELRAGRRVLDAARDGLARAERQEADGAAKRAALTEALVRIGHDLAETGRAAEAAAATLADLPDIRALETELLAARAAASEQRVVAADRKAALGALTREVELAARRRGTLAADLRLWTERAERAAVVSRELADRLATARRDRDTLASAPDTFILRRRALATEVERLDASRRAAADRLRDAEARLAELDRAARAALDALSAAREKRAGSQARAEALATRVDAMTRAIRETFGVEPAELLARLGSGGSEVPDESALEERLGALKADRERLGGVNLRAEEELAETLGKSDRLAAERDDLVEAIRRLRGAVGTLNREARERLAIAFTAVAGHFGRLFTTLFGGGEAALTFVESDDPLEAGLEITARPPGKKPALLSLLSGGEQALTATALIFAVFLTNPSPVCVLDEVDAPLDDANVERYCDLLRTMVTDTDTRFLVITHNPITMSRMDRLFGVTMAERGVSQLVSVDLGTAEQLREAG